MFDYSAEEIISSIKIAVEEVDSNEALGIEAGELRDEAGVGGEHLSGEDPWLVKFIQDVGDSVETVKVASVDGREQPFLLMVGVDVINTAWNFKIVNLLYAFTAALVEVVEGLACLVVADSSTGKVVFFRGEGHHSAPSHCSVVLAV